MEIILKKDIVNLGYSGDVVTVKAGYALNYLIPQGFAITATKSAIKQLEEIKKQRAHKEAKLIAEAEALAAKVSSVKVKLFAKVSSGGKIFGSITTANLAEELLKQGIEVDKRNITILSPSVKTLGEYKAELRCYRDVKATFDFVIEEQDKES